MSEKSTSNSGFSAEPADISAATLAPKSSAPSWSSSRKSDSKPIKVDTCLDSYSVTAGESLKGRLLVSCNTPLNAPVTVSVSLVAKVFAKSAWSFDHTYNLEARQEKELKSISELLEESKDLGEKLYHEDGSAHSNYNVAMYHPYTNIAYHVIIKLVEVTLILAADKSLRAGCTEFPFESQIPQYMQWPQFKDKYMQFEYEVCGFATLETDRIAEEFPKKILLRAPHPPTYSEDRTQTVKESFKVGQWDEKSQNPKSSVLYLFGTDTATQWIPSQLCVTFPEMSDYSKDRSSALEMFRSRSESVLIPENHTDVPVIVQKFTLESQTSFESLSTYDFRGIHVVRETREITHKLVQVDQPLVATSAAEKGIDLTYLLEGITSPSDVFPDVSRQPNSTITNKLVVKSEVKVKTWSKVRQALSKVKVESPIKLYSNLT